MENEKAPNNVVQVEYNRLNDTLFVKASPEIAVHFRNKGERKDLELVNKYYRIVTGWEDREEQQNVVVNGVITQQAVKVKKPILSNTISFYKTTDRRYGELSDRSLFESEILNIGVLRMEGIENGITFFIKEGLDDNYITNSIKKFATTVKSFYNERIRAKVIRMSLGYDEV